MNRLGEAVVGQMLFVADGGSWRGEVCHLTDVGSGVDMVHYLTGVDCGVDMAMCVPNQVVAGPRYTLSLGNGMVA
jgi:hypothetical protein